MLECQKIRKVGLDPYGAECIGKLICATVRKNVGLKGLMSNITSKHCILSHCQLQCRNESVAGAKAVTGYLC